MNPARADRSCDTCGQSITVTSRNPNRRFCSPRCRAAHHRTRPPTELANDVTNHVTASNDATHAVPTAPDNVTHAVAPAHAIPAANGIQRCPHCRAELAVIAVVVPTTAAHVRTPEVIHISPPDHYHGRARVVTFAEQLWSLSPSGIIGVVSRY